MTRKTLDDIVDKMPTKYLLPEGEGMERFLKREDMFDDFKYSRFWREHKDKKVGMREFIKERDLFEEWEKYWNSEVVKTELEETTDSGSGT